MRTGTLREQIVAAYKGAANDHERRLLLMEITGALDDVWGTSNASKDYSDIPPEFMNVIRRLASSLRQQLDVLVLECEPFGSKPSTDGVVSRLVGHASQLSTQLALAHHWLLQDIKRLRAEREKKK